MSVLLPARKANASATDSNDKTLVLPDVVRQKLNELGINGDVQVQAQADLDMQGRWGHRFLVATPHRLVVLSAPDLPQDGAADTATSRMSNGSRASTVTVDLDVPLQDIVSTEAKTLVGAASLEARVRNFPSPLSIAASSNGTSVNGTLTNGTTPDGVVSNGALPSGISFNGAAANGAMTNGSATSTHNVHGTELSNGVQLSPDVSTERIVELLRASNAHSRGLTNAARQLKQLREDGEVKADVVEDAKWQRQTCGNCGRACRTIAGLPVLCEQGAGAQAFVLLSRAVQVVGYRQRFAKHSRHRAHVCAHLMVQPLVDRVFNISPQVSGSGVAVTASAPGPREYGLLALLVGAILFASALGAIVSIMRGRTAAYLGARVIHDIRSQVYEQLQRLSLPITTNAKSARL
jgi:hypothetical protein